MSDILTTISEPSEVARLEAVLKSVIGSDGYICTKWLKENNYVAVPVESASHFDEYDAERLSLAIQKEGSSKCFAVSTECLKNFPCYLRLGTSINELLNFSRKCAHYNFLLVSPTVSFAVLCTVYDYFVLVGTATFVENALGRTIPETRSMFYNFADESDKPEQLIAIAQRYAADSRC